jgi:flagellar biosynthesis/type III secretory pathway protein FliH
MSSFEPARSDWLRAPAFAADDDASGATEESGFATIPNRDADATHATAAADHEAGRQAGLAEASLRLEPVLKALADAAEQLELQRTEYLGAQRQLLMELAIEVATKLVGDVGPDATSVLGRRIGNALDLVDGEEPVSIRVCPSDHHDLMEALDGNPSFEMSAGRPGVDLSIDEQLMPGDALVTSGPTSIDARMSTLLGRVREALLESGS